MKYSNPSRDHQKLKYYLRKVQKLKITSKKYNKLMSTFKLRRIQS